LRVAVKELQIRQLIESRYNPHPKFTVPHSVATQLPNGNSLGVNVAVPDAATFVPS